MKFKLFETNETVIAALGRKEIEIAIIDDPPHCRLFPIDRIVMVILRNLFSSGNLVISPKLKTSFLSVEMRYDEVVSILNAEHFRQV